MTSNRFEIKRKFTVVVVRIVAGHDAIAEGPCDFTQMLKGHSFILIVFVDHVGFVVLELSKTY